MATRQGDTPLFGGGRGKMTIMPFDLDNLLRFCVDMIRRFAADHQNEDFYAFAISGSWLCLNSEQEFAMTLKQCQEQWDHKLRPVEKSEDLTEDDLHDSDFMLGCLEVAGKLDRSDKNACLAAINESRSWMRAQGFPYRNPAGIRKLRENTGNLAYEGFADMVESGGFDDAAYNEHWYLSDQDQKTSEYGTAMDALLDRLRMSGVFACLKTTSAFYATRVEHNY